MATYYNYEEWVRHIVKSLYPYTTDEEFEKIMSKKHWTEWSEELNISEPKKIVKEPDPPAAEEIEQAKKRAALEERIRGMEHEISVDGWYTVYKDKETGERYIATGCTTDDEDFDYIGKVIEC